MDLVQQLFHQRSASRQQQDPEDSVSPAILQLQQKQQVIQQQIAAQLRQEQLQTPGTTQPRSGGASLFSPPPSSQLVQPVPAR